MPDSRNRIVAAIERELRARLADSAPATDAEWRRDAEAVAASAIKVLGLPPVLMGLSEIAEHYAITRQLAQKWTARSDFPAPLAELKQGKVWDGDEVFAWGDRHGRVAGGGPGAPKGAPRRPA